MATERVTIPIFNLGCAGGGALTVEQALRRVPGVAHAYVNPATEMAYVDYDPALTGPGPLRVIIARAGYGPPTTRPRVTPTGAQRATLDVRRLALAAGLALSAIYVICLTLDLLFPQWLQMYRLWEQVLIGVTWERPETLLLGLVETFLYGALGIWLLAGVYSVLPPRVRV